MSSQKDELFSNKYSTKRSSVPGTFFHNLPYVARISSIQNEMEKINIDGFVERKIRHLNDEELANDWRLVLPNFILRKAKKDNDMNKKIRYDRYWKFHKFSVHLGQVPYHLMSKIKKVYNEEKVVGYYVREKIYEYKITLTNVDKEILTLAKILKSPCPKRDRVSELKQIIQSQGIKGGWVLLKASKFLGN